MLGPLLGERFAAGLAFEDAAQTGDGVFRHRLEQDVLGVDWTTARVPFSMWNSRLSQAGMTTCPLVVNQTECGFVFTLML